MEKSLVFLLLILCFISSYAQEERLLGEAIPNHSADNIGTFDFPGVSCTPIGIAYLSNTSYPDLFIGSDRWYPGYYYYPFKKISKDGVPVFSKPKAFKAPVDHASPGCMLQEKDKIYGFWYHEDKILMSVFNQQSFTFEVTDEIALQLPRNPGAMFVERNKSGDFSFVFSISDGRTTRAPGSGRSADYIPYSPSGVYNGEVSHSYLYQATISAGFSTVKSMPVKASIGEVNVRSGHKNITKTTFNDNQVGFITGSRFGNLNFHQLSAEDKIINEGITVGENLITLRHPVVNATPLAYPGSDGKLTDLIVSGEGGIYFYKYVKYSKERNAPIYKTPKSLLAHQAQLKGGSLVVPTMVDWDGDGLMDIVSGNSRGQVLFFKNVGSQKSPKFISGEALTAEGHEIHIQPGYGENIQGPGEARWGYTCPNVVDWNMDGLYDIVMGDSRGKHSVFLNTGTKEEPKLAKEHPLYLEGLDLHGTWRCKPGVAKIGDRMAYVTLDDDDEFHLYWQLDAYNLQEGFKLRLEDGQPIKGNFLKAGGTGRLKFNVLDWDLDGTMDLIVGTPRHGCVPNPEHGLPWTYEKQRPGSAVLFLKNVGTDSEPVYQFPKLLKYKEEPIFLGQHSCAPTSWYVGNSKEPSLLIGRENGMFYFFDRKLISW